MSDEESLLDEKLFLRIMISTVQSDIQVDTELACPLPSSGRLGVCFVTSLEIWSASEEPVRWTRDAESQTVKRKTK